MTGPLCPSTSTHPYAPGAAPFIHLQATEHFLYVANLRSAAGIARTARISRCIVIRPHPFPYWAALISRRLYRLDVNKLMSNDSVQSAFIEAAERRQLLCDPPPGSFDKDSPALNWVRRVYASTHYKSVFVSTDRYPDFLAGEGLRAGCALYVQKHERAKGKKLEDKVFCVLTESSCFTLCYYSLSRLMLVSHATIRSIPAELEIEMALAVLAGGYCSRDAPLIS